MAVLMYLNSIYQTLKSFTLRLLTTFPTVYLGIFQSPRDVYINIDVAM